GDAFRLPLRELWPTQCTRRNPALDGEIRHLFGCEERTQVRSALAGVQQSRRVACELAEKDFALYAMPQHVFVEAQRRESGPSGSEAPVGALSKSITVRVRMIDMTKIIAEVQEQTVWNMKMSPSARVTNGFEIFDAAEFEAVVEGRSAHRGGCRNR